MATTALHHHVAVFLQDNVAALVKVEDGDAGELGGGAAGLGHLVGDHQVDEGLHDGVVGRVHVGVEGEAALAVAVEGGVAVWSDDPVLPAKVPETDVERPLLAAGAPEPAAVAASVGALHHDDHRA